MFSGTAWSNKRCSVAISHCGSMVKTFREGRHDVQDNLRIGRLHVENNTSSISCFPVGYWSPMDCASVSNGSRSMSKTVFLILHGILCHCKPAARWIPNEISEVQRVHCYAVAQTLLDRYHREGDDFLERNLGSLIRTKLETPIK